jgi:hypothetical protein
MAAEKSLFEYPTRLQMKKTWYHSKANLIVAPMQPWNRVFNGTRCCRDTSAGVNHHPRRVKDDVDDIVTVNGTVMFDCKSINICLVVCLNTNVSRCEVGHALQYIPMATCHVKQHTYSPDRAISPKNMVPSEDAEAMIGCVGWKTASLTLPLCPGSL